MSVTGSDEKPPGKVAENWSRSDHIRAGSVSGPWRSVPREESGARPVPPASARKRPASTSGNPLPLDWMRKGERSPITRHASTPAIEDPARSPAVEAPPEVLVLQEQAAPGPFDASHATGPNPRLSAPTGTSKPNRPPQPADRRTAHVTPMPRSTMAPVIAAAVFVAVAIVVAATLLRPDAPGSRSTVLPETEDTATAAIDLPTMRLRVGPGFPPERQAEIMTLLTDAGHDDVLVERIPFSIAVSRVGYYRPEDRAAATELARLVSSVLDEPTGSIAVRDYSELIPDAVPGRLDLWIGDREGR